MNILSGGYIILTAYCLDLILGDPECLPHPVRWMGRAIGYFEPRFRKIQVHPTISGGLFAVMLIACVWAICLIILTVAAMLHPFLKIILEIIMIYYCISIRSLSDAAMKVCRALRRRRSEDAKQYVSRIVGRDTAELTDKGIIRAAVETVAENLVDGVISPLFFIIIGGAPLGMAYKMINTLDSMVGYKNETYRHFGKISARMDDIANFIPARLSVLLVSLSTYLLTGNGKTALITGWKEGKNHTSPNSGYSEAAFAGALQVWLGGPNTYRGILMSKPLIGTKFGDAKVEDIKKSCDLMMVTSLIWVVFCAVFTGFW